MDIFSEDFKLNEVAKLTNINKEYLLSISNNAVSGVLDGAENPLEVYIKAKAISTVADNIISSLKDQALDEAKKYSPNDSLMLGVSFVVKQGSTKYSFDHDVDCLEMMAEIDSLQSMINSIQHKLKDRQKKMIEATKFAELVDKDTGEVIPPAHIDGYSQDILTINIPKQ